MSWHNLAWYGMSCCYASINSAQIISRDLPEQSTWQLLQCGGSAVQATYLSSKCQSKAWGFLGDSKGKIIDKKKVYCKLCEPVVAISYSTNTSNLTYHLLKRHPEEHRKVTEVKDKKHRVLGLQQATLQEAIASAVPYSKVSKRAKHLVSATADSICQGLQPINVVDEPSFRTLLAIADPKFQLLHQTYFSTKIIPEKYIAVRGTVDEHLAAIGECTITSLQATTNVPISHLQLILLMLILSYSLYA